jgi:predicted nicotinamide N-methyase
MATAVDVDLILPVAGLAALLALTILSFGSCLASFKSFVVSPDNILRRSARERIFRGFSGGPIRIKQDFDASAFGSANGGGVGASVWRAAISLGRWLEAEHNAAARGEFLLAGKSVLELGAGTGLTSVVCARLGAERVVCTDGDEALLPLTERNVSANLRSEVRRRCRVMRLRWGHEGDVRAARAACGARGPDVVVAADVVYRPTTFGPLVHSLGRLMRAGAKLWLGYTNRFATDALFFEQLERSGLFSGARTIVGSRATQGIFEYVRTARAAQDVARRP